MTAVAPAAPGRIGTPVDPDEALAYLRDLGAWAQERRRELDALDAAVLRSPLRPQLTRDMMLALALWKAADDRLALLRTTWGSGRVGVVERERIAALIWGRLDETLDPAALARATGDAAAAAGLAVSLPEACRLSDAMAAQLRTRLAIDPNADAVSARLRDLRAQLDRLRDQVALEPAGLREAPAARLADLAARVDDMVGRLGRGGDIGGMIGPAEIDAARFERDLIVGGAERRAARDLVGRTREQVIALEARETALRGLVDRVLATVSPAPKYAVPDVSALGPLPNTRAEIEAYAARLGQVGRALQVVQDAYAATLAEHEEYAARLARAREQAQAAGLGGAADLVGIGGIADEVLGRRPSPLPLARELVEAFETCVRTLTQEEGR